MREEKEETGLPEEDFFSIRMRAFSGEKHLSGGEDLVERSALRDRLLALTEQGLTSSRNQEGVLPSLNIRVEPVKNSSVLRKTLLPVHCLESSSHQETLSFLSGVLEAIGSRESIDTSSLGRWLNDVLNGTESGLSGASLFFPDGERWIPENRGVRVTQFGMVPAIRQTLLEEAKKSSCRIRAEICGRTANRQQGRGPSGFSPRALCVRQSGIHDRVHRSPELRISSSSSSQKSGKLVRRTSDPPLQKTRRTGTSACRILSFPNACPLYRTLPLVSSFDRRVSVGKDSSKRRRGRWETRNILKSTTVSCRRSSAGDNARNSPPRRDLPGFQRLPASVQTSPPYRTSRGGTPKVRDRGHRLPSSFGKPSPEP